MPPRCSCSGMPNKGAFVSVATLVPLIAAVAVVITVYCFQHKYHFHGLVKSSSMAELYQHGTVVTDNIRCAQIGRDILKKNGSAVDAAISTSFCLGTYSMRYAGIGGGGVMLVYKRNTQTSDMYDFKEMSPQHITQDMLYWTDEVKKREGIAMIAVPGEIKGLYEAHQKYGKMKWQDLIQPTIDLCENGFRMTLRVYEAARNLNCIKKDDGLRNLLMRKDGKVKGSSEILYNKPLANTLKRIAVNPLDFYNGSLAEDIVEDIQTHGGVITLEDLRNYKVKKTNTITTDLDHLILHTTNVGTGGPILAHVLKILQGYNFEANDLRDTKRSVLTYHRILEALKFGYAQSSNVEDTDFMKKEHAEMWLTNMTSSSFGSYIREMIKDDSVQNHSYYGDQREPNDDGTTQISVYASNGDAVSMTTSINSMFGSCFLSTKTGILYNNQINDFIIPEPKPVNATKWYNMVQPNKRPPSSMSPIILTEKDGQVRIVLGSSGGKKIIAAVVQGLLYMTSFGMDLGAAISHPRLYVKDDRRTVFSDKNRMLSMKIVKGLKRLGHHFDFDINRIFTALQGIYVDGRTKIYGKADPRTYGYSAGY